MGEYKYIGKVFGKYDVNFPLDEKLLIMCGNNGSGKTKALECLNDYLLKNDKEKTLFLQQNQFISFDKKGIDSLKVMLALIDKNFDKEDFEYDNSYSFGEHITSGKERFLNMLYAASKCVNGNLLIDFPETHLDLYRQEKLIKTLLNFDLKRLIIVTHSPGIIFDHHDHLIDIKNIVNLYENI